jgi:hypothetical protein
MSQELCHGAIMESGVAMLPDFVSSSCEVVCTVSALISPTQTHCLTLWLHGGALENVSVL